MKETCPHLEQHVGDMGQAWQDYQEYLSGFGQILPEPDFFAKNRKAWNFSRRTKEEAFAQHKANGDIPEDANMRDYQGHHVYPVSVARKRGLDRSEIKNASNCAMLKPDQHKQLHDHLTNEEMADYAEKPKQKGFWG